MKGFTLIELLVTIILMGMIISIVYLTISDSTEISRNKSYDIQINNILSAAKNWAFENINLLPENENETYKLSLENLQKSGNMSKEDIINPKTGEKMNGCIYIKCLGNCKQYEYSYLETSCMGE